VEAVSVIGGNAFEFVAGEFGGSAFSASPGDRVRAACERCHVEVGCRSGRAVERTVGAGGAPEGAAAAAVMGVWVHDERAPETPDGQRA
jgi:hypothetical protein